MWPGKRRWGSTQTLAGSFDRSATPNRGRRELQRSLDPGASPPFSKGSGCAAELADWPVLFCMRSPRRRTITRTAAGPAAEMECRVPQGEPASEARLALADTKASLRSETIRRPVRRPWACSQGYRQKRARQSEYRTGDGNLLAFRDARFSGRDKPVALLLGVRIQVVEFPRYGSAVKSRICRLD